MRAFDVFPISNYILFESAQIEHFDSNDPHSQVDINVQIFIIIVIIKYHMKISFFFNSLIQDLCMRQYLNREL